MTVSEALARYGANGPILVNGLLSGSLWLIYDKYFQTDINGNEYRNFFRKDSNYEVIDWFEEPITAVTNPLSPSTKDVFSRTKKEDSRDLIDALNYALAGVGGHVDTQIAINDTLKACVIKCECGSESCGSPKHSQWCPKYES